MGVDREVAAHHEAGHAVAAHVLGLNVDHVTIEPEGGAAGHVVHEYGCNMNEVITKRGAARQWALECAAIVALAGEAAQHRFRAESVEEWHGGEDRLHVHHVLDNLAGEADQELRDAWGKVLVIRTERLIAQNWRYVEWLATLLLKQTTIEGRGNIRRVLGDADLPMEYRGKRLSPSQRLALLVENPLPDAGVR